MAGVRDLTLDCDLLRYLNGIREMPDRTLERCMKATRFIWLGDEGALHVRGRGHSDLIVPPLHDCISIVRHVSGTLEFPDGEHLY